jgi:predicted metalloprotease with PDZ domain
MMKSVLFASATWIACLSLASTAALGQTAPIQIAVDLSDVARHLYHAEIDLPVKPGPLTLTTPKWIPGEHRPTLIVDSITGIVFTANGQTLPWRRDDVDLFEYHVSIPQGVTHLHAHLDLVNPGRQTDKLAAFEWQGLLLYPAHIPVRDIPIQPTVIVPAGWGVGTALTPTAAVAPKPNAADGQTADLHAYAPTNVEQLEDSPLIMGQYFKEFPLAPDVTPKHYIDVVADEDGDQNLRPALLAELNNLVHETGAMYASRHYYAYHFLLTLTDNTAGEGLEHGQSSDNGVGEKGFSDPAHQLPNADLLALEFTHSWNGKYRRPDGLYQPDFATPEKGEGLWVYEGMTQYLGNVLAARSGLKNAAEYRDIIAASAANLDNKPGREWRTTEDTAIASSILRGGTPNWSNWKRGQDYYQEGELLWLDIDTLIRSKTNNKKSLNDFERIFLGKGGNTGPLIDPYSRAELISDLNEVMPYDWAAFLHQRVDEINPRADLAGFTQGGWRLTYADKPTASERRAAGPRASGINVWYSIGIRVGADGTMSDVKVHGPADVAHLAPTEKILAVDGRTFSGDRLREAIRKAKGTTEPIHLIVESQSYIRMADLNYHDGERYPTLERIEGTPDLLDEITKPLTKPEVLPEKQSTESGQ